MKMTSKVPKFLLTWLLTQQMTGLTEPSKLDMAPDAFDDQYEGCVEDMEKEAPQLLKEDFKKNKTLEQEWEMANKRWDYIKKTMSTPKGFHDSHGTAVVAYTSPNLTNFRTVVKEFTKNSKNFHYTGFHYYLTRALQLLWNNKCYTVYRGTSNKFHYSGDGSVRFGHFASSSSNRTVALKDFGGASGTMFTIKTCLGVNITEFSYNRTQQEVLIPGYEVFTKVSVTASGKGYDNISLHSTQRKKSNYNCKYRGSTNNSHFSSSATLLLVVLPGLLVLLLPLAEL